MQNQVDYGNYKPLALDIQATPGYSVTTCRAEAGDSISRRNGKMTMLGDCVKGARNHTKPLANPETTAEVRRWNYGNVLCGLKSENQGENGLLWH